MKQLKDFIHLYLGCECLLESEQGSKEPNIKTLRSIPFLFGELHAEFGDNTAYSFSEIKPLLRPLSDMTEEERLYWFDNFSNTQNKKQYHESEWVTELNNQPTEPHWTLWTTYKKFGRMGYTIGVNNRFTQDEFHWLLSKHFDLFGLIEAGLAIDKTLTPSP